MNPQDYKDIFEPFDRLIEIEIEGVKYRLPENNTLLRGFQFLSMESISYGDFCWNGDCAKCQVWIEDDGKEKIALACRTKVEDGMKIVRMNEAICLNSEV
jgi:predicted molibdopterin-dependent oxidoreductase YjgC